MANPLLDALQRRDALVSTAIAILDKAKNEGRGLTAQEQKDVDGLHAKVEAVGAEIDARQYFQAGKEIDFTPKSEGRRAFFDGGNMGGSAPAASASHVKGTVFASLGEQLGSVIQAGTHGGLTDGRLHTVQAAATGLNEGVGSDGGFLLEPSFSFALLESAMASAKLAPRCGQFPVGANSNGIDLPIVDEKSRANGSRFGGLRLFWGSEGGDRTASKPKFGKLSLKLNKLTGLVYLTDEIVQDSAVLGAFVERAFTSEYAFVIDDAIMRGPGAGQPLGFLQSPALVSVPKESEQEAKTIVTENIVAMYSRQTNPEGAVWLANKDTFPQLMTLQIGVGTAGQLVSALQQGVANSPSGMAILGRPVLWMEQCSTLGTVGDLCFVDPSRYLLATKGGLQTAYSAHVRFLQDEGVLRFTFRLDGQPELNSPITPANGTNTVSPFVALATRA